MKSGINISLFDMFDFDSDNTEPKVTNKSVEDTLKNNEKVIINNENEEIHVGNEVDVEYDGQHYIGVAHSIYNDGTTVNVIFDHMHSAFHISKVNKL